MTRYIEAPPTRDALRKRRQHDAGERVGSGAAKDCADGVHDVLVTGLAGGAHAHRRHGAEHLLDPYLRSAVGFPVAPRVIVGMVLGHQQMEPAMRILFTELVEMLE